VTGFSLDGWPFLALLLAIPAGWWLMRRNRVRLPFPGPARLAVGRSTRKIWWHAPTVLRSSSLALVAIALVHPVRVWERVETEREGVAIVLAVDISSSMLAEDFRPDNRIEVAKREVIRFIEGREADWVGLVAFAGEALTMVPGTLDHAVVESAVERLEAGQLRDGTAIGVAPATAANRLRDLEPESRIVVLLTDGDNNSGSISPEDAAAAAASLGIRVYTIGVGRDGVAPVPVARTAFGYQYANVRVHVNDELLEDVATQTGGLYFRATDPEGLTRIYDRINELETTPIKEVRTEERVGLRRELLFIAIALILLELLAAATRSRRVWT
jgi:Ca-activated chloride channel family protein